MSSLHDDYPELFLNVSSKPCISLYQPTHRTYPEREQDNIRYKNLLKIIECSLKKTLSIEAAQEYLKPFNDLLHDYEFWQHMNQGLAILANQEMFKMYKLPRPVPEIAMVADGFHIKPLIRIMQSADRFQILALTRTHIKLYEGTRDQLSEVDLHPDVPETIEDALGSELTEPHLTVSNYGKGTGGPPMHHGHGGRKDDAQLDAKRFFRRVDEAVTKYHSRVSRLPLLLATLPEYHHLFHTLSENEYLLTDDIQINPDELSPDELRQRAWQIFQTHYLNRLDGLISRFQAVCSDSKGSDQLDKVAQAAIAGRVETLLIDADKRIPGQIDSKTGQTTPKDELEPHVDDLLDELGEFVLKSRGDVVVVPSDKMPTDTGLAAIYRY